MSVCTEKVAEMESEKTKKKINEERYQKDEEEKREVRATFKKIFPIIIAIVCIEIILMFVFIVIPNITFKIASSKVEDNNYEKAIQIAEKMGDNSKTSKNIYQLIYEKALALDESGNYSEAISVYEYIFDYSDVQEKLSTARNNLNEQYYQKAVDAYVNSDYNSALSFYEKVPDYKDAQECIEKLNVLIIKTGIKNVKINDTIFLGMYCQENDSQQSAIEWQVLNIDKKNKRVLVLSKYVLDCIPYNSTSKKVNWGSCSLNTWLNKTFLENTFNQYEKKVIKSTTYDYHGEKITSDLFLLADSQASNYLATDVVRQCAPTQYAINHGVKVSQSKKTKGLCQWWLSCKTTDNKMPYVKFDGEIKESGTNVTNQSIGVRPAMWVSYNISKSELINVDNG